MPPDQDSIPTPEYTCTRTRVYSSSQCTRVACYCSLLLEYMYAVWHIHCYIVYQGIREYNNGFEPDRKILTTFSKVVVLSTKIFLTPTKSAKLQNIKISKYTKYTSTGNTGIAIPR